MITDLFKNRVSAFKGVFPAACVFIFLSFWAYRPAAEALRFIDAHSQVDHELEDLRLIIQRMDEAGVSHTILAARSGRTPGEIAAFARENPEHIIPAVRTKSGAYNKDNPKYYQKLRSQIQSGKFSAMAEVLLYHARKGQKAPEVVVYPTDRRVQTALKAAVGRQWPFVIHIEFASLERTKRQQFMEEMEHMLDRNAGHPFALIHMGQLDAREAGRLLEKHQNLYFLTAHTNPVIIQHSREPWTNMFKSGSLTPAWRRLIVQNPGRFIFALDNVWARHWENFYLDQVNFWRRALAELPPETARALARDNARRLWKIEIK